MCYILNRFISLFNQRDCSDGQGKVVAKMDRAIHWIVIFSTTAERHKNNDNRLVELASDKK